MPEVVHPNHPHPGPPAAPPARSSCSCRGSIGVPIGVVNTKPDSGHRSARCRTLTRPGRSDELGSARTTGPGSGIVRRDRAVFVGITLQLTVDALQTTPHLQRPCIQVDVLPAQPEHLAAPQPQQRDHHEHRVQPVVPRRLQERPDLLDPQRVPLRLRRPRRPAPASPGSSPAAPPASRPRGRPAASRARTGSSAHPPPGPQPVEVEPNLTRRQPAQPLSAQIRDQVAVSTLQPVGRERVRPHPLRDDLRQPLLEVGLDASGAPGVIGTPGSAFDRSSTSLVSTSLRVLP